LKLFNFCFGKKSIDPVDPQIQGVDFLFERGRKLDQQGKEGKKEKFSNIIKEGNY